MRESSISRIGSRTWTTGGSTRWRSRRRNSGFEERTHRGTKRRIEAAMFRKYFLPLVALVGVVFAIYVVRAGNKAVPASQPVAQPAAAPFRSYIAGAGIVEAQTENIAIGTGEGGTVIAVHVKVGDRVTK